MRPIYPIFNQVTVNMTTWEVGQYRTREYGSYLSKNNADLDQIHSTLKYKVLSHDYQNLNNFRNMQAHINLTIMLATPHHDRDEMLDIFEENAEVIISNKINLPHQRPCFQFDV